MTGGVSRNCRNPRAPSVGCDGDGREVCHGAGRTALTPGTPFSARSWLTFSGARCVASPVNIRAHAMSPFVRINTVLSHE